MSLRAGPTPRPSDLEGVPCPGEPSATPWDGAVAEPLTVGILSTYPPTACGLATFSAALAGGLLAHGVPVHVVRVSDGSPSPSHLVVAELDNGRPASVAAAADVLNGCDVAIVQHEYGIYGGADGDEVVEILAALRVPAIVIAHTALSTPTAHQRSVLVEIAALADHVVVMSDAARGRLVDGFAIDAAKVDVITHGAAVPPARTNGIETTRPTLLTWGLVGPGKGIERVIDAMPHLQQLSPRPRYLVAGRTHPKVLASEGEAYRHARIEQAWRNGVAASVSFDADYRDVPTLTRLVQSAAAVVLPYDSRDQATSGVLVDAIAAGRPVIATAFPHAVELLASGAGIIVDHDDPDAMVEALTLLLTDPGRASQMAAEASRLAPELLDERAHGVGRAHRAARDVARHQHDPRARHARDLGTHVAQPLRLEHAGRIDDLGQQRAPAIAAATHDRERAERGESTRTSSSIFGDDGRGWTSTHVASAAASPPAWRSSGWMRSARPHNPRIRRARADGARTASDCPRACTRFRPATMAPTVDASMKVTALRSTRTSASCRAAARAMPTAIETLVAMS